MDKTLKKFTKTSSFAGKTTNLTQFVKKKGD
uniref:Uncharacterized protein n=1 Tax=uncultured bacterium Ad_087_C16_contig2 TaxID=1489282 RepID=A0A0B4N061_9BACT|nr:unknown [uncultured bacterium Ad_087_C16_contig2]